MLYQIRMRLRDSTSLGDLPAINKAINDTAIPALESVDGVNACRVYNSIHGDLVWVLDMDDITVVNTILQRPELGKAITSVDKWLVRSSGGDVLYDRGPFQTLYAGS